MSTDIEGLVVFSGDVFGDPRLSIFVGLYDSIVDLRLLMFSIVECMPMMMWGSEI